MYLPPKYHMPLLGMLCCSFMLNVYYIFSDPEVQPVKDTSEHEIVLSDIEVEQEVQSSTAVKPLSEDWKVIHTSVKSSIIQSFIDTGRDEGKMLSAVYTRLFMWDLNMRRDLQRGDKIEVVYRMGEDGMPDIAAARFHSRKMSKTFSAYKWLAPGDSYPSYWSSDGSEAVMRLKESPIASYEQITALLKDGRGHKGMDFKAPVGTVTTSPKSGVVTRVNFGNLKRNGNCVEVRFADGILAKWLHLSEVSVSPGESIRPNTKVGLTGNTGRSTAPHLHYQLNRGKKVLDPIDYHGTIRRTIPGASLSDFLADVGPFISLMDNAADAVADSE